ncbi:cupredoxin domain-containing protein [Aeromicrobium ginsengisoli]|uniref:cupredoxin domain-containing protein n=1 Tax=Aeromicrobium ginsengisoli TaxID=363867 RepID=UPI001CB6EA85|nr:plastocyanin/azurin family copper-binding protein [Aeromicrobium ginsengisoli]
MSSRLSTTPRKGLRVLLASILAALAVMVWPASEASAASHQITIKNYAYGSGSMSITQGDTVTWTNQDSVPHDVVVTSGPAKFRSPMLTKGKSWSYTFASAGAYSYTCSVHPDMHATISAKAKPVAPAPAATTAAAAAPTAAAPTTPATTATKPVPTTTTAAPAPDTAYVATTADDSPSLDPMLLLLGLSTAIVVFCLLLLASRPHAAATTDDFDGD